MDSVMVWVWLGLIVFFVVIEAVTANLVSVWFIAGALASFIATLLSARLWLQIVIFVVVSGVFLALIRPLAAKRLNTTKTATNADMNVGKIAVVTESIDNDRGEGRAEVGGLGWAAQSSDGSLIKKGAKVVVEKIEGVRLIVSPAEKE